MQLTAPEQEGNLCHASSLPLLLCCNAKQTPLRAFLERNADVPCLPVVTTAGSDGDSYPARLTLFYVVLMVKDELVRICKEMVVV
jgi:hypothetical protein